MEQEKLVLSDENVNEGDLNMNIAEEMHVIGDKINEIMLDFGSEKSNINDY